jgi:hypothetical protein
VARVRDPLKVARDGASYAKYRLQAVGTPMAVVFDGDRVCCLDAGSRRVERLAQVAPERIAGIYQPGVDREAIVEDLLIVLGD